MTAAAGLPSAAVGSRRQRVRRQSAPRSDGPVRDPVIANLHRLHVNLRRGYPVFDPSAPLSVLYRTILSQRGGLYHPNPCLVISRLFQKSGWEMRRSIHFPGSFRACPETLPGRKQAGKEGGNQGGKVGGWEEGRGSSQEHGRRGARQRGSASECSRHHFSWGEEHGRRQRGSAAGRHPVSCSWGQEHARNTAAGQRRRVQPSPLAEQH